MEMPKPHLRNHYHAKCREALLACNTGDPEADHSDADTAILVFLRDLGFGDVADLHDAVEKWYA